MNEETTTTAVETTAGTPETTTDVTGMDAALESAVNEVMATDAAEKEATDAGKIVDAAATAGEGKDAADAGDAEPEKETKEQPTETVDYSKEQELFDRGVKAGLSVKDLLDVPTYAMAEKMVELAEKANGISKPDKGKEDEGAGTPADELSAALEEMEKDGEYDPKILKLLKGLYNENKALKSAGKTAEKQTFFEQQFGSLDEALRGRVDAVRKSQLKSKFDLLEAGYKAQGSHIQREDVFKEATKLALGDLMGKVAEERKTTALEQRKNLTLARPGGEAGKRRGTGPATDEEIASEIWDMIR